MEAEYKISRFFALMKTFAILTPHETCCCSMALLSTLAVAVHGAVSLFFTNLVNCYICYCCYTFI